MRSCSLEVKGFLNFFLTQPQFFFYAAIRDNIFSNVPLNTFSSFSLLFSLQFAPFFSLFVICNSGRCLPCASVVSVFSLYFPVAFPSPLFLYCHLFICPFSFSQAPFSTDYKHVTSFTFALAFPFFPFLLLQHFPSSLLFSSPSSPRPLFPPKYHPAPPKPATGRTVYRLREDF